MSRVTADRRTFLKATGVTGAAVVAGAGPAAATDASIDDALDTAGGLQETLVVFDSNDDVDRLRHLDLDRGYHRFEVLPIGYTLLTGAQIETVGDWPEVRRVQANGELEYHNDDGRETTGAGLVQSGLGYTGANAHAVVIDSGVDADHPDLADDVVENWRYVNPLSSTEDTTWIQAGDADSDDNGHGTHCSGSITASGELSDGQFRGTAPDAALTVYSAGLTLLIVKPVAAYDHLLARQRDGEVDVQVVSNSWGATGGPNFEPDDPVNVATWHAYEEGILALFSAGNSGPATDTLNPYALAPHVLGVAATDDDRRVVDFSSRGRRADYEGEHNWDRAKALRNLEAYHAADKTETVVGEGSFSGVVGPATSEFHEWTPSKEAGYVDATLSWTPGAADVDFYLREGSADGEVIASGATLNQPEELSALVDDRETYYFEVRPFANAGASYELTFTVYEGIQRNVDPLGVYRPGVAAPGELVMSTLAPEDPLQAYYHDTEVWYGRISGTSMSCPITAGCAALVFDAYSRNHGEFPDPVDVLATLEAEAEDVHDAYAPWNVGAGFVAVADAVRRAEEDKLASLGQVRLVDY